MSNRNRFIIGVVLLLVVILVIEYRMPRRFEWVATFSHTDPQPFGCLVFDSVMKASMPMGYTVDKRTLWQMRHDSVFRKPVSLLVVSKEGPYDYDMKTLMELAGQGHTIMVATTQIGIWNDTLGINWHWNNNFTLKDVAGKRPDKGRLTWVPTADGYAEALSEPVYDQLIERTIYLPKDTVTGYEVLFEYTQPAKDTIICNPIALSCPVGKGELILVSAPLLFTNYMTVSGNGAVVQGRLMDRLKHHPVIRSESFMSGTAMTESSPFYVFLKQPPLRWALYLTVLGILLFCCFTSRRRQRVIPVIQKPQNRNLEFVQLIGTLYWHEHDNTGLLAKKLAYTEDEIRRQNVRISPDDQYLIDRITQTVNGQFAVTDQELKAYIKELDRIQHAM